MRPSADRPCPAPVRSLRAYSIGHVCALWPATWSGASRCSRAAASGSSSTIARRASASTCEEVDDAYRAWQDRTRDLLRFFFITHELHEAQLRELYRRMCLRHGRHTDEPRRDVETDLRDLETVA